MKTVQRVVTLVLSIVFCFFFIFSVIDTEETRQITNFDQDRIVKHIEKLSENGPRSIAHKEANEAAVNYIVSQVEALGAVNGDTVDKMAYLVHDYTASGDDRYQNWYLKNVIVHIPANTPEKTGDAVMFMGHLDSVPMGQGASDDGVACAVMLEAIRYYSEKIENGYSLSNDLVFCFVNGEEYGLYGSEALLSEFDGFDDVVDRTKFVTNLESRGTGGTVIMFETAKNNYNTVLLFSEVNQSLLTCSIATMIYDMMPNYTDFTTFKDTGKYQGINMANIVGGENYHTQNDSPANVGASYLSQQAQIVDALIGKLSDYELDKLYKANESAIFFSYLDITTVVYDHTTSVVLGIVCILMIAANIILSVVYRKEKNLKRTLKAILTVISGLVLSAAATYAAYYIFQLIAALFGVIDIHMIGTITYSNTAIVIGIGILSLAMTVLCTHFGRKWLCIEGRDLRRAFAYVHATLGIVLTFVLPDASYLFITSGLLFMANELICTAIKKTDASKFHGELLASALYLPIMLPIIVLATSALGLTMAYVYGLVFALTIFDVGVALEPVAKYLSVRSAVLAAKKKPINATAVSGALHLCAVACVIFLCVSLCRPNAGVNLQGKQNIAKLPYDDALVYVVDESGNDEYRIYDLNAYSALKKYSPEMNYNGEYYVGEGESHDIPISILSTAEGTVINVKKADPDSLVYLDFSGATAESYTVSDGVSSSTHKFDENGSHSIKIHTDCTVTLNGGSADVAYRELFIDYAPLVQEAHAGDENALHFNLWLTAKYKLGK